MKTDMLSELKLRYGLVKDAVKSTIDTITHKKILPALFTTGLVASVPNMVNALEKKSTVNQIPKIGNTQGEYTIKAGNRLYSLIQNADPSLTPEQVGYFTNAFVDIQKITQPEKVEFIKKLDIDNRRVEYDQMGCPTVVDSADGVRGDVMDIGDVFKYDAQTLKEKNFTPKLMESLLGMGERDGWFYSLGVETIDTIIDQVNENTKDIAQNSRKLEQNRNAINHNTKTNQKQDAQIGAIDYRVHALEDERDGGHAVFGIGAGNQDGAIPIQAMAGYEFASGVRVALRGKYQTNPEKLSVDSVASGDQYGSGVTVNNNKINANDAALLLELGVRAKPFTIGIGAGMNRHQESKTTSSYQQVRDPLGNLISDKSFPEGAVLSVKNDPVATLYLGVGLSPKIDLEATLDVAENTKPGFGLRFVYEMGGN